MKLLPKFGVEFHQAQLKNGANVFLFKRKGMPIYLRAIFFAGSRFDNIPGTAHFLEHMLVAGTEKFPTKNLIAEYIQKVGGDFGASTNNTFLRFNIEIPEAIDMPVGIEVMTECLTRSIFNARTIETERGSILSELNAKKTNPNEYLNEVFSRLAFQDTLLEHSTLGNEVDVQSITRDMLIDFGNKHLHLGNVSFIVSGDVEIDYLTQLLDSISLPIGKKNAAINQLSFKKILDQDIEFYPGVKQLQVMFGCHTPIESYKEYCALRLLNQVLASGRGSRLVTKLRYESGLVYSVFGSILRSLDWGQYRIRFSCNKDNFEKAKQMIVNEFNKLQAENITETEFQNAKSKISKGTIRDFQTSDSWINSHEVESLSSPNDVHTIEDYIHTIEMLTLEDISSVINKYLHEENFYTAICGDYR
ncbi:MAG: insulinase family protein [Candidatus Zambryskibacteria bacterium]|nr:insulinase family protein [Candidatus Zambryskibacteria bacterium]